MALVEFIYQNPLMVAKLGAMQSLHYSPTRTQVNFQTILDACLSIQVDNKKKLILNCSTSEVVELFSLFFL